MRAYSFRSGFTMIEIIIALSLIGIFVAVPIIAYSRYIKSSRDIRRKNDINQVQAALEQYKSKIGKYPAADNLQVLQTSNLLPDIPKDPLDGQPVPGESGLMYHYDYQPTEDLLDYQIIARLESKSAFYKGAPIGNTEVDTVPGSGLPTNNTPVPQNTLIPSLSAIPSSTVTPTRTPTPSTVYWSPISSTNNPSARYNNAYVWTGSKMFIFGGDSGSQSLHDGALYNPSDDTWSAVSGTNAPANAISTDYKAVWTGSKVIIWGDRGSTEGGIYDPAANTWLSGGTATTGAPAARYNHTAIWTGNRMIVWGGNSQSNGAYHDGGIFNPSSGTNGSWSNMSASPLTDRTGHTAVWTTTDMIIWGGVYGSYKSDGAKYNPTSDTWTMISNVNAPSARTQHIAVWTGQYMIIWGGRDAAGNALSDGGMYDPVKDTWTSMISVTAPVAVSNARAVLYNGKVVVWGGDTSSQMMSSYGGIFEPGVGSNGKWTLLSINSAPAGRIGFSMVANNTHLIIWGGFNPSVSVGGTLSDGAKYLFH